MPLPLLTAHTTMLPRLEAEESIVAAEQTAVGAGMLKADARQAVVSRWRTLAQPQAPRVERPTSIKGTKDLAKRAGIGVKIKPRPATS